MTHFRFVVVVWGTDFTDAFLKVCLPSQLFPGNLIYFAQHTDSIYYIYTTAKDANIIKHSSIYKRLSAIMPVKVLVISGISYVGKYQAMTQCHAHFIRSANDEDCAFIFMTPDIVWADGSFARLLEISKSGKRVVAIGSVRLTKETFIPAFLEQYGKDGNVQPITPRQLVKLALNHLHPSTLAQLWCTENNSGLAQGELFWQVSDEGLLLRHFRLQPLMVRPVNKDSVPTTAIDADYTFKACPDPADIHIVHDSDEMCYMDFTPRSDANQVITIGNRTVEKGAEWARVNTEALHRQFVRHRIRLHWGDCSEKKWGDIERRSDAFVDSVLFQIPNRVISVPSPLSRSRYISPRFLAGKVRQMGAGRFFKQLFSVVVHPLLRKVYGSNIRISMVTDAHTSFSKNNGTVR